MEYLIILAATVLMAVNMAFIKVYQKNYGAGICSSMRYNCFLGIFATVIFWAINGFSLAFTPYSVIMGVSLSLLVLVFQFIGFKILAERSIAIYTMFLMAGGMVVPYAWGLLVLHEPFSWRGLLGVALITVSIILMNTGNESRPTGKQLALCILVFFLNGTVTTLSKLHQINEIYQKVPTTDFLIWTEITKFVGCAVVLLILAAKRKNAPLPEPEEGTITDKFFLPGMGMVLLVILAATVSDSFGYMLQLTAAKTLSASIMYPFLNGGNILFSALAGRLFFKEKFNLRIFISIVICVVGTCFFL